MLLFMAYPTTILVILLLLSFPGVATHTRYQNSLTPPPPDSSPFPPDQSNTQKLRHIRVSIMIYLNKGLRSNKRGMRALFWFRTIMIWPKILKWSCISRITVKALVHYSYLLSKILLISFCSAYSFCVPSISAIFLFVWDIILMVNVYLSQWHQNNPLINRASSEVFENKIIVSIYKHFNMSRLQGMKKLWNQMN